MMKFIKYFFGLIFTLNLNQFAFSQVLPDRVHGTSTFLNEIQKNYTNENSYPFKLNSTNVRIKIPVKVHIIKNIKGLPDVSTSEIANSLNTANSFFQNIGISFFIDSVNFVNDYNYGFITYNHKRKELLTLHAAGNKINLFLADSILMGPERSYGFTYFPDVADSNYIFLDKKYIAGNYLTTMLGHFMGLLSTHESGKGSELADEKNCAGAGDFICDTYADPDLDGLVDENCVYTGDARDNSGNYFIPTVANIMSNAPDSCKCIFTPQQYRRMYYYFLKYRQKLKF